MSCTFVSLWARKKKKKKSPSNSESQKKIWQKSNTYTWALHSCRKCKHECFFSFFFSKLDIRTFFLGYRVCLQSWFRDDDGELCLSLSLSHTHSLSLFLCIYSLTTSAPTHAHLCTPKKRLSVSLKPYHTDSHSIKFPSNAQSCPSAYTYLPYLCMYLDRQLKCQSQNCWDPHQRHRIMNHGLEAIYRLIGV